MSVGDGLGGEHENGEGHEGHRAAEGAGQYSAASDGLGGGTVVRCGDGPTAQDRHCPGLGHPGSGEEYQEPGEGDGGVDDVRPCRRWPGERQPAPDRRQERGGADDAVTPTDGPKPVGLSFSSPETAITRQ